MKGLAFEAFRKTLEDSVDEPIFSDDEKMVCNGVLYVYKQIEKEHKKIYDDEFIEDVRIFFKDAIAITKNFDKKEAAILKSIARVFETSVIINEAMEDSDDE